MNTKYQEKDIEELRKRIYNFVIRVVNLVKELPNNLIGNRIGWQLLDAGTSIGANFEEACAAFSKRDFTYKLAIAKKEAYETNYWLRVIRDTRAKTSSRDRCSHRNSNRSWPRSLLVHCHGQCAGSHNQDDNLLQRHQDQIELVFLPTYSPHLNRIERLWRLMRGQMTKNQFYDTVKDRCEAVVDWLVKLPFAKFCKLLGIDESTLGFSTSTSCIQNL